MVTNNTNIEGDLLQEENAISYQPDTTWLFNPNVSFGEDVNKDGFSWSQFFQGTANHSQGFLDTRHGEAFMEGFKDGIARYDKNLPCRWVNHRDINDGFHHPNPVYSRAYETGYESQQLGIHMTDRQIEDMFTSVVRDWYAQWHEENNK